VRGANDCGAVINRKAGRSKYGGTLIVRSAWFHDILRLMQRRSPRHRLFLPLLTLFSMLFILLNASTLHYHPFGRWRPRLHTCTLLDVSSVALFSRFASPPAISSILSGLVSVHLTTHPFLTLTSSSFPSSIDRRLSPLRAKRTPARDVGASYTTTSIIEFRCQHAFSTLPPSCYE
jgi:hypothetical protein